MSAKCLHDTLIGSLAWSDLSAIQGFYLFKSSLQISYTLGQLRQTILLERWEGKGAILNVEWF